MELTRPNNEAKVIHQSWNIPIEHNKSVTIDGITMNRLRIEKIDDNTISISIYGNGVCAPIGLARKQIEELREFLNTL